MTSQIQDVSKNKVGDRATFDANSLLFHDLHQLWIVCKMESVTNSLGIEQNSIIQLCVASVVGLSTMEKDGKFFTFGSSFCLSCIDLRQERLKVWSKILLVDHVESNAHVRVLRCLKDCVNLCLDVSSTQYLETTSHNFHLE